MENINIRRHDSCIPRIFSWQYNHDVLYIVAYNRQWTYLMKRPNNDYHTLNIEISEVCDLIWNG
jgi:hypothetical protein